MASFPPLKKSLFRIITVITIICLLVISCSIPASAFTNSDYKNVKFFNVDSARPSLSDSSYYAELLYKRSDGTFFVDVVVFSFSKSFESDLQVQFSCNPNGFFIVFNSYHIKYDNRYIPVTCNVYSYSNDKPIVRPLIYSRLDETTDYYSYTASNAALVGAHLYGFQIASPIASDVVYSFVVNYSTEGLFFSYFLDLFSNFSSYFESLISSVSNIPAYLETLIKQNHELLNGISDSSDEDTRPPPDEVAPPRDDSTIDDIKDAEKDAVGGKTDEEIQQDVEDTLDYENQKEQVNGEDISTSDIEISHNVFNVVFDFMGGSWNSYFILTLTVAFAAFLIGRRY